MSWVTMNQTADSFVQYGLSASSLNQQVAGEQSTYATSTTNPGARYIYMHDALIAGLQIGARYYYRVGSNAGGWSAVYPFDTQIDIPYSPVDIIVYGDMGTTNSNRPLVQLAKEIQAGFSSLIIHTGNFVCFYGSNRGWRACVPRLLSFLMQRCLTNQRPLFLPVIWDRSCLPTTGDFAYNMEDNDGRTGDEFMNLIQPVAAVVPYMTCVG